MASEDILACSLNVFLFATDFRAHLCHYCAVTRICTMLRVIIKISEFHYKSYYESTPEPTLFYRLVYTYVAQPIRAKEP